MKLFLVNIRIKIYLRGSITSCHMKALMNEEHIEAMWNTYI